MTLRARLQQIYGSKPITAQDAAGDPLKRYLYAIQQATNPKTGAVDFDKVDAARQGFSAADNAYIDRNVGVDQTPLSKRYRAASQAYYAIPQYRGYTADEGSAINALVSLARAKAGSSEDAKLLRALRLAAPEGTDPRIQAGARKVILGLMQTATERKQYLKKNPDAAYLLGRATDVEKAMPILAQAVR